MAELYRDYFDIDPEFFPAVNASVIEQHPNLWEKFYPHETFVKLMRDLISCVSRLQKLSVWVEGEYGTGKSHAVLTLKKLLEADDATTKAYFDRFPEQLGNDLYNKLYSLKHAGSILVVHRYASSDITSETDLLFDVQDSIVAALREKGYKEGDGALRSAAIQWLSDPDNKAYFNGLMKGTYAATFGGDDVDALIKKLLTFEGLPLSEIMTKVMKVANERGIRVLTLTKEVLQEWIRTVIKDNNLYGLIFIWDEFTDFFKNNRTRLSGLQALVEMSEGDFFYMIPVTHNVANLFPAKDKDWNVISHRFVQPFCNIELPDNMAFRLMGKALEKRQDTHLMDEWSETSEELYERTRDARALVKKQAKIQDTELRDVLPLHPYAALLLKNMASYYAGDVRSMFDFLKNDTGDEIRGFKWFIDTFGPADDNPLLTVELLWDFFYEKGKELLDRDVRKVLDSFGRARNLIGDEPRILKAILLMQAIYEKTGSQVEALAPSAKNIEYAFMGSDLDDGQPTKIADSLVRKKVLYKTPGSNLYSALLSTEEDIPAVDVKFSSLLAEGEMQTVITLKDALKLRYDFTLIADASRLEQQLKGIVNQGVDNRIHSVIAFAKSGLDAYELSKAFSSYARDERFSSIVFIDATLTPLGDDRFEQISDSKAKYEYWTKKNSDMAGQFNKNVGEVLTDWRKSVMKGEFIIYWGDAPTGKRVPTLDELYTELSAINRKRYPDGLETFAINATPTMWQATQLMNGVKLGASPNPNLTPKEIGQFSCVPKDLGEAWTTDRYWETLPLLTISKIKRTVDEMITEAFRTGDRISIRDIYEKLYEAPYGFMPCNQTAFILGFLLREYTDGSFSSSDGIKSDKLDIDKLKNIVSEYMSERMTPTPRYKDKYIVKMTAEIKAFVTASATIFGRPVNVSRMEDIRDTVVRPAMHALPFPMWCLKHLDDGLPFKNSTENVHQLIDLYTAFANSGSTDGRSDNDIATDIGRLVIRHPGLAEDLHSIMSEQKVREGMKNYLDSFEEGILPKLGEQIGDGGQYITRLQKRFSADAANWVWFKETADQQIRMLILEYRIVVASNAVILHSNSFRGCIEEWCNVCKNIKLSYLYAKSYWDDLGAFMEILYGIKKTGDLQENRREQFLQLITDKGAAFKAFYNHQEGVFANACSYILQGLDADSISEIYKQLPGSDLFTSEKSYYQQRVQETVKTWSESQEGAKLIKAWKDATKTESPRAWSQAYLMPVLCMVDDPSEEITAKEAFDTINAVAKKKKVDGKSIEDAMKFLQSHAILLQKLDDSAARDDAFRKRILGRYDVLLQNIEEVKHELEQHLFEHPYDWYHLTSLENALRKKAEFVYNGSGYELAVQKIDGMDIADVKRYLKELIEKNMTVGIEIIREN